MGQELSHKSKQKLYLVQKKLIRIITCSPYRAHTEPLRIAYRILDVTDINTYIFGIFMYDCMNENVPNSFQFFFRLIETSMIMMYAVLMTFMYPMAD